MKFEKKWVFIAIVVLLIVFMSQGAYSQPNYKRSYEFGLTNLALLDLTFIFTQLIKSNTYIEITNSFVYHKNDEYTAGNQFVKINDPFELYNLYRFRVGIRYFLNNVFYVTPMLIFNVGGFNDCLIRNYIDVPGSYLEPVDYRLSRTRYDIGTIIKLGFSKSYDNHFLTDIYFGFGFKVKYFNESITEIRTGGDSIDPNNYPIVKQYTGLMPTIHFGVLFGYAK